MTSTLRLPRVLTPAVKKGLVHNVRGVSVGDALDDLFAAEPGLRGHILDDEGRVRPHVLIFVNQVRAELATPIPDGAEIQVLQAVSGGWGP